MTFEHLLAAPDTAACRNALELAREHCSPALLNHSVRSYVWAAAYAEKHRVAYDAELLYVAAVLHDIGLVEAFDNYSLPFEEAGGHVVSAFAAGAGWPAERRRRAADVVIRHMWDSVDPAQDSEGFLLELSTGLDISGRGREDYADELCELVLAHYPRLGLADEFAELFRDQAERKPGCAAELAVRSGLPQRLALNPLEQPLSR